MGHADAPLKVGLVVPGFAADAVDWCIPALTNLARALAARPGVELHVYALRYPPRAADYRLLIALSLRLAAAITVPSSPMRRQLQRHYPQYAPKALPWAFGVDVALFTPAQPSALSPQPSALSNPNENSKRKTQNAKLRVVQ